MPSEVTELSPIEVELTVRLPWERVQKQFDDTYRQLGRTARVRGFRPGKVPRNVLKQVYGKQIDAEVTAGLVEAGLVEAVREHSIDIVAEPHVTPAPFTAGTDWTFKAKLEVRPKIEKVDLSKLAIVKPSTEVTNAMVDEEVERLRKEHAALRVPEPMRPSAAGDELVIDYQVELDGTVKPDMSAEGRKVELGEGSLIPEFEQGLLGTQPGESKEIAVAFPADHERPDLQGKTAKFNVSVRELREKLLPDVDDELAKDVGDFQTLLELRLDIRKKLEDLATRRSEAMLKDKLIDKLVETNEIPVPPSMVQSEERRMLEDFMRFLKLTGGMGNFGEDFVQTLKPRAERKVRAALLLGAIAREQSIDVGDADIDARLATIAEQSGKHVAKVRAEYQGERREALENQILEEKLMDYLRGHARMLDTEEAAEAEAKSAKAEKKPKAEKSEKAEKAEKAEKTETKSKATKKAKAEAEGDEPAAEKKKPAAEKKGRAAKKKG